MGGKRDMRDPRFVIEHAGDPEYSLVTRSSDGQMLFLANKLSKMKQSTALGSRIAEVHNGSSLFTGDAGQGESNIRRWIIENDWLEAIGRTERLIHGLREYRARLINDVVTGRVDVRDALPSTPDHMPVEEFRVEQEGETV